MRNAFVEQLCIEAEKDDRIWLICGDLGYSVLEPFAETFPSRFINAGVAEQNMMGLAAGIAHSGCIPYVYSIANFPVMRCLEQIRNDVCYHNLPVRIVAVGGGLTYASHGYSHHGVEDLAVMRVMPNISVFAPGDPVETRHIVQALTTERGPAYLRLGKAGEPIVHETDLVFSVGKAVVVREGIDACIVATGGILTVAVEASDRLAQKGKKVRVISMPSLVPFDTDAVLDGARTGILVTIEEHASGGLASLVSETLALNSAVTHFHPLKLAQQPSTVADDQNALRARAGLTAEAIIKYIEHKGAGS